jgi:antitoxin ParD1/3/4
MQIDLPNDATRFIEGLVASGEYPSPDDAVADGVRLLMARRQLQTDIQRGIDELDAGDGIEADRVFAELRQRSKEEARQAK